MNTTMAIHSDPGFYQDEDSAKANLINYVNQHIARSTDTHFFSRLLNKQRLCLLDKLAEMEEANIDTIFKHSHYILTRKVLDTYGLNKTEINIVIEAIELFGSWPAFWCACEIQRVKDKYQHTFSQQERGSTLTYKDADYTSELHQDISQSEGLYKTLYFEKPMSLADCVLLINLELFVKGEHWYEMLSLLDLSVSGQHFILCKQSHAERYPTIVSTALIQNWKKRDRWLSYCPAFNRDSCLLHLTDNAINTLNKSGVFQPELPPANHYKTIGEFDRIFSDSLYQQEKVCEVLRFTVSGNQRQKLYLLYLGQKQLMTALRDAGYKLGLTIIEQPFMLKFYRMIDSRAYFHSAQSDITGEDIITYRGFWMFDYMVEAFQSVGYSHYKKAVFRENKRTVLLEETNA